MSARVIPSLDYSIRPNSDVCLGGVAASNDTGCMLITEEVRKESVPRVCNVAQLVSRGDILPQCNQPAQSLMHRLLHHLAFSLELVGCTAICVSLLHPPLHHQESATNGDRILSTTDHTGWEIHCVCA